MLFHDIILTYCILIVARCPEERTILQHGNGTFVSNATYPRFLFINILGLEQLNIISL